MARSIERLPQVKQRTGLSTSQIYVGMAEGWFPLAAKLFDGAKAVGWFDDEISAWVESRRKARDAKLAAKAAGKSADGAIDADELAPEDGEDADASEDADAVAEATP
jgi:prophage regulatory protein